MERYIFENLNEKELMNSGDSKAMGAFVVADELVADPKKNMAVIMIISFDLGVAGVSFSEIAQFLYDNYSNFQLMGLHKAITDESGVTTVAQTYDSPEELAELKAKAKTMQDNTLKKMEGK